MKFRKIHGVVLLIIATFGLLFFLDRVDGGTRKRGFLPVGLTGVQHMGSNFNVPEFYVDGYGGGNVGREGGGGSNVCCILLPEKWRPGLTVELRWMVGDWSKENHKEIEAGNYQSVKAMCFKAIVPIEKYDQPEQLNVHFFSGGRARIVSSIFGSESEKHPIRRDDLHASKTATTGIIVPSVFTDAEIAERDRKNNEQKTKRGSWK